MMRRKPGLCAHDGCDIYGSLSKPGGRRAILPITGFRLKGLRQQACFKGDLGSLSHSRSGEQGCEQHWPSRNAPSGDEKDRVQLHWAPSLPASQACDQMLRIPSGGRRGQGCRPSRQGGPGGGEGSP